MVRDLEGFPHLLAEQDRGRPWQHSWRSKRLGAATPGVSPRADDVGMSKHELIGDQLLETARAAAQNAQELLADAQLLQDHGRHARAFVLAVAAGEEVGKAMACGHAVIFGMGISAGGVEWRRHENKLEGFFALRLLQGLLDGAETLDGFEGRPRSTHQLRMAAMYVDSGPKGVQAPADQAYAVLARELIEATQPMSQVVRRLLALMTPELMEQLDVARPMLEPAFKEIEDAFTDADPDERNRITRDMGQLLRGLDGEIERLHPLSDYA